eukprot:TRINITY_DN24401_c0_g1_i1.p1 TRINITY_DN24401_c0_g1~~TRINITY_DN24401_c0_g1_i1.p1  ORF type:complete len:653 (-),score=122.04 TRINITY_DN24401_c0_g1_i1:57-2015(-)
MSEAKYEKCEKDDPLTNGLNTTVLTNRSKGPAGCVQKCCSKKTLTSRLPIVSWLPAYDRECAISDLIAGVTVGLTVIPQGIAYAIVAGLPPQYGLYSAFMGCFVYCVFGSSKDITIGPTAIMALMTGVHAKYGPDYAVLLAFLSGLIVLACGLLQLGFLIDFISVPVIAGFTSAAALTIASGQIKSLFGLTIPSDEKSHTHLGVVDGWIDVFTHIDSCRWQDATLGLICCVILLSLRALNRTNWFKPANDGQVQGCQAFWNKLPPTALNILSKVIWFICTGRNAIIVILCLVLAAIIDPAGISCKDDPENCVFTLTGQIESGLPSFQAPPFGIFGSNETSTEDDTDLSGMISQLGSAIIIIPLIAILESVAIAKAFAGGKPVDASQEMIALGVCNLFGSFVQSMPTTGSFSRTAVNSASGVRTPMGGIYTGGLVILCLAFLMPYCAFIPKATLAAVIITAVVFSVEYEVVMPIWRSKRTDLIPGFACFLGCLFYELEMGIGLGVVIQVIMLLYHAARPGVEVTIKKVPGSSKNYLCITPNQGVVFPSVSYVRNLISKAGIKQDTLMPVVIDCSHIYQVDYTAAKGFNAMLGDFSSRQQEVFWLSCNSSVANTISAIAGDLFVQIKGPHQVLEDQRDGEEDQLLVEGPETSPV